MLPDLRPPAPRPGDTPRGVVVLGSTGSVGRQALEVAALFPDKLRVVALAAGTRWEKLAEQARAVRPRLAVIADPAHYPALKAALSDTDVEVQAGADAVRQLGAAPADVVVAAIVGAAGLAPTLEAVEAGRTVALANKEALVVAGALVRAAAARSGAVVVPVDSEHSALFQCLVGEPAGAVERLVLTASGGPFRQRDGATFGAITPAEAVAHPNWSMGAKISVDSATMMNKGLEVIEAHWLFGAPPERIDVVVHPESVVHSVVEFVDGSSKAQVGPPDMKVPIQVALSFPERWPAPHPRLDWSTAGPLTFEAADRARFPCLDLAYAALGAGGSAPAALNAANEVAVARFLAGDVSFPDISRLVEAGLAAAANGAAGADTLDALRDVDRHARRLAGAAPHLA